MKGLYVLDMWTVLCFPYVGGGISYCDWKGHIGYVVSLYFDISVLGSNIRIVLFVLDTCGQFCLSDMEVVGSNIAIGLYVLDMWSVLCVPYVGVMVKYSDWSVCSGHVVSVVCFICGGWDLI